MDNDSAEESEDSSLSLQLSPHVAETPGTEMAQNIPAVRTTSSTEAADLTLLREKIMKEPLENITSYKHLTIIDRSQRF
jgi:hypothetical protein